MGEMRCLNKGSDDSSSIPPPPSLPILSFFHCAHVVDSVSFGAVWRHVRVL